MVQEFHVLRCHSCQTFQVQQVKKSKGWNCKMCGAKQSAIKEFGRGSGADCRRHVQKLNAMRGETLEEQDQQAWLRWEEVGSEAVEDCEDRPQDSDQQNVEEPSRWSKYLDKPGEGQAEEKTEEEEEENVFMDRNQIHGNRNVRKRKRTCGWQKGGNRYHCGKEDTMAAPNSWRTTKPAKQTRYSSSFIPVEKSPKAPASCGPVSGYAKSPSTKLASSKPPLTTAPNRLNTITPSHPRSSSTTTVSKASKWAQFLTAPSPQDEEGGEGESCWMSRDEVGNVESHVNPFHPQNKDNVTLSYEQPSCGNIYAVGGLGSVCFKKSVGMTFSRLKSTLSHCGFGETNSKSDPTHMSSRLECTKPICEQPQPTKPPYPSLPVAVVSLFNTGEDFDDTFEFDDIF